MKHRNPPDSPVSSEETVGQRILKLAADAYASNPALPRPGSKGYRAALVKALGIASTETLRQWEVGISRPNKTAEAGVAKVLKCAPESFMFGVGPEFRKAIAADKATALTGAIEMLGDALALVPVDARQELADLMRLWCIYGGKDLYGTGIVKLLDDAKIPVDTSPRIKFSSEALQLALLMDQIQDGAYRSELLAAANNLLAREQNNG